MGPWGFDSMTIARLDDHRAWVSGARAWCSRSTDPAVRMADPRCGRDPGGVEGENLGGLLRRLFGLLFGKKQALEAL